MIRLISLIWRCGPKRFQVSTFKCFLTVALAPAAVFSWPGLPSVLNNKGFHGKDQWRIS
jgi:hypothetical protein